jgi:hypothetical protein
VSAQDKHPGLFEGKGTTYNEAADDAHKRAAQHGHGTDDWLVIDEVRVRGHNPIVEYLVVLKPHKPTA